MYLKDWFPAKSFFGWISPSLEIHDVGGLYKHADFFKNNDEFKSDYDFYLKQINSTNKIKQTRISNSEEGDYLFLHHLSNDDKDSLCKFYKKLYSKGWMRIGAIIKENKLEIEVQGIKESLNLIKNDLLKLKNRSNIKITFGYVKISKHPCQTYDIDFKII